jgi:hypothetical protein
MTFRGEITFNFDCIAYLVFDLLVFKLLNFISC